jgi:hypothetical protein
MLIAGAVSFAGTTDQALSATTTQPKVYAVDKRVGEFPEKEDLSSPELTYAAIARIRASGKRADWSRVLPAGQKPPAEGGPEMPEDFKQALLTAKVLEVRMSEKGNAAAVIARLDKAEGEGPFDIRHLVLEGTRWVNAGQDNRRSMDEARKVADLVLNK